MIIRSRTLKVGVGFTALTLGSGLAMPALAAAAPLAPIVTTAVHPAEGPGSTLAVTVTNPYAPTGGFSGWCYAEVTAWPSMETVWRPDSPPCTPAAPPTAAQIEAAGFAVPGTTVTKDVPLEVGIYLVTATCLSPEGTTDTANAPLVTLIWPG
jgi:hypothetical protein